MHIDEHFTDTAIFIFASPQIDFMSAHSCFLRIALTAMRQLLALGTNNPLNNFFNDLRGCCCHWRVQRLCCILIFVDIFNKAG